VCERVAWWYARRTYGRLSAVMTAARGVQDQLDRHGLIATYHAPLGVDTVLFNPNRRSPELRASIGAPPHGAPADGPVIFFPHRLTEEKGLQIALEAFDWISQHVPAHLVVAGTGPGEPLLRSHMQRNERIHYLGYVADRPLLADWYASSDLVFALSPFETFGLAALEGMASGCPLVAAHGGALPELVQGAACGIVVQRERTDLVAQAALSLLCDSELHRWASTNARAYAESHHDWDGTFDTIVRCYADLLS
jgi:alpha-1,6-mannosyltransferase